jgi:hypothetical protein
MSNFSFARFVTLLARTLEAATITALVSRWIALFVMVRYRAGAAGSALDVASNFAFLAILLLLLSDLWLLLTHQRRGVFLTLRTFLYILAIMIGPYRLGGSPSEAAQRPNQAMQLTASRRTTLLSMTSTLSSAAMRALARSSSSCSR